MSCFHHSDRIHNENMTPYSTARRWLGGIVPNDAYGGFVGNESFWLEVFVNRLIAVSSMHV